MKILLLGEYSRLHNSLKEGLQSLNHDVTIVACGDNFKGFPVDLSIFSFFFTKITPLKLFNWGFYTLFKVDLQLLERGIRFYIHLPKLKNYDVIQLINSDAIETYPWFSSYLLKRLFAQNQKTFLLICGEETPIIDFLQKKEFQYSILSPLLNNPTLQKEYRYTLKYTQNNYRKLFQFVSENSAGLISSDLDYSIPMQKMGFNTTLIPNPINTHKIKFRPLQITNKIIIFLGINTLSGLRKGSPYFEKALEIITEKYVEKVEIIITKNILYNEYITLYDKAHILLDQIYSLDQGYNALEAMAKGKVVFTGAELEFMDHYNLNERVAINAIPDVDYLVRELSVLIENPNEIIAMGKRARAFVEKEHDYIKISEKYLEVWNGN